MKCLSVKKRRKKGLIPLMSLLTAIMVLITTGCQGIGLRRQAYTAEELENYLENKYQEEFTVLTRTEVYDSYTKALQQVEYEIQYDADQDIIFSAMDKHNGGMAGWSVSDDFQKTQEEHLFFPQSTTKI